MEIVKFRNLLLWVCTLSIGTLSIGCTSDEIVNEPAGSYAGMKDVDLFDAREKYIGLSKSDVEKALSDGKLVGSFSSTAVPEGLSVDEERTFSATAIHQEVDYGRFSVVYNEIGNAVDMRLNKKPSVDDMHRVKWESPTTGSREVWEEVRFGDVWKREGLWTKWARLHVLEAQCYYKEGVREGRYIDWFLGTGIRTAGEYKKGKKHGTWREWDIDGKLVNTREYVEGIEK